MRTDYGFARSLTTNVAALAAFWVLLFSVSKLVDGQLMSEVVQAGTLAVAGLAAVKIRARVAALFLGAMLAFTLAELTAHAIWSVRVVAGRETHLTVIAASLLGVTFGALLTRFSSPKLAAERHVEVSSDGQPMIVT